MVHRMKGVISSSILFLACFQVAAGQSDSDAETLLREHSNEFLPELIQVTDRVYVASGYGASNSAMIVGDTGLIIIDTRESKSAARAVLEQFRTVTDKPVKAIVYTHGHVDHTNGTTEFVGNEQPEIYARDNFRAKLMTDSDVFPVLMKRTVRQFGFALSPDQYINMGLGVKAIRDHEGDGYLPPTIRFADERFTVTIDGVDVELVAAPGETDDQLYVWLPDDRVLFPGDNFYKAFPNLYPIRGAAYRDVKVWADSLQKMRTEGAEYLIPSHTRPISGAESVDEALRVYAEAIRYVYDETISGMNKGMTADQLAASISLPDELAESPYLQEFYGSLEWGVRSVFSGLVGWFDGNPTNLRPLNNAEEAARIVELAGGADEVFATLGAATDADDFQWALQLADYLLAVEYRVADVTAIKVDALRGIAALQSNATARNYYLTVANEMERK